MVLLIALIALAGAGFFFSHVSGTYGRADIASLISGQAGGSALAQRTDLTTTAIRPASEADQVSAAGNIELSGQRPVVLRADGVSQVAVEVGDVVAAGDLLVSLDTADLEWR
jgi:multidrug efflux pump subunit AcrA (membrane-fusion protein)